MWKWPPFSYIAESTWLQKQYRSVAARGKKMLMKIICISSLFLQKTSDTNHLLPVWSEKHIHEPHWQAPLMEAYIQDSNFVDQLNHTKQRVWKIIFNMASWMDQRENFMLLASTSALLLSINSIMVWLDNHHATDQRCWVYSTEVWRTIIMSSKPSPVVKPMCCLSDEQSQAKDDDSPILSTTFYFCDGLLANRSHVTR